MTDGYSGQRGNFTGGSQLNATAFLIRQIIAGKAFAAVVTVKRVTNAGGITPAGVVAVQPMVNQIDGRGNQLPHGTIYNLPYFRLQGGANAVIIDPAVGDIGLSVICDRDISSVKATRAVSGPGSRRQNSHADGLYLGGFLNGVPTQFVAFSATGILMSSPTKVTITAPAVQINSTVTVSGDVIAQGTHLHTHIHPDPQGGVTGAPIG